MENLKDNLQEVDDSFVLNTDIDNLVKENEALNKKIDYWSNEYFEEKRKHKADVEHLQYFVNRYFELLAKSI